MNLLFDFITTSVITGASEYVRRVFYSLVENSITIKIYGLYDSRKGISPYSDLTIDSLKLRGITCVDIKNNDIFDIVNRYQIDSVFIGCAQYWGNFKHLENLKCQVFCVIHDLSYEEKFSSDMDLWLMLKGSKIKFIYNWLKYGFRGDPHLNLMRSISRLLSNNSKARIIAVSDYTKTSILYQLNILSKRIEVLYSPERVTHVSPKIKNEVLKTVIESGKNYYLLVSGKRPMKNAKKAIHAFDKFAKNHPEKFFITVGCTKKEFENQIPLPFLDESDLMWAYKNCYAFVYPSLFEGFGYPPIEAMRFGKPILSSNVCSMPEILGNAPIYFSPIYETEIYKALNTLSEQNYKSYVEKSLAQYSVIHNRQERDLKKLIRMVEA